MRRRRVWCWFCGNRARRMGPRLRVGVVGTDDTVPTFGLCMADLGYRNCYEPMMLRKDARYVLGMAVEYERGGWNVRSEYDA